MSNRNSPSYERGSDMKRLTMVLWLTAAFACVEFLGAYLSHSLSLRSDAVHMVGDVGGIGFAWVFAVLVQRREISGRKRAEALGAWTSALLLIVISLIFVVSSSLRFFSPHEVESGIMLMVGGGGLGVNILGLVLLYKEQKSNLNTRGAYLHIQSDALSSVGVVVGALAIGLTGQAIIDPIVGILIAFLILRSAGALLKTSWAVLTRESYSPNGALSESTMLALIKGMRIPGVQGVHAVTVKRDEHFAQASLHIVVADNRGRKKVLKEIRTFLRRLGIRPRVTVCDGESQKKCQASVS